MLTLYNLILKKLFFMNKIDGINNKIKNVQ